MENNISEIGTIKETGRISFKDILMIVLSYRILFLICVSIALIDAYLINRYSTQYYEVQVDILLSNLSKGTEGADLLGTQAYSDELNVWDPTAIKDKIQGLTSPTFLREIIKRLHYNHSVYSRGNLKATEVYPKKLPVYFFFRALDKAAYGYNFRIKLYKSFYNLNVQNGDEIIFSKKGLHYNDSLVFKNCVFMAQDRKIEEIWANSSGNLPSEYSIYLEDVDVTAERYSKMLFIENIQNTKILSIYLEASEPDRAKDFIEEMAKTFIDEGLAKKNEKFANSLAFINSQLKGAESDLGSYEQDIESLKRNSGVLDLASESGLLLAEKTRIDIAIKEQEILLKKVTALKEYVDKNKDLSNLAPATFGISDPLLIPYITAVSSANSDLNILGNDLNPNTSQFQKLKQKLIASKKLLVENINNIVANTLSILNNYKSQMSSVQNKIGVLPGRERVGLGMIRKSTIQEKMYILLLERKFEFEIAQAGTQNDYSILNEAKITGQTKPDQTNNYTIAVLLGLIIPSFYVFLKIFLDNKIRSRIQIERITSIPFLSSIPHYGGKNQLVFDENSKSNISESFRNLRTNINFMLKKSAESKVILITSSVSGEGKTFCSLNIAQSLALSGAKVIILGLDLRKPRLHLSFGLTNEIGMSTYLTDSTTLQKIIFKTDLTNVDIVPSGPVPPNPSELLSSQKMIDCIIELKSTYQFVILDTAPIGLVTDSIELMTQSNLNVFIVREGFTHIKALKYLNEFYELKNIKHIGIVLNDSAFEGEKYGYGAGYGYGYSYGVGGGYGYGYGYNSNEYVDDKKPKKTKKK